jgi:hypothetical protein
MHRSVGAASCRQRLLDMICQSPALLAIVLARVSLALAPLVPLSEPPLLGRVMRFIEIAQRVDTAALAQAAALVAQLADREYLAALRADCADESGSVIHKRETPYGPIVFAGPDNNWHRKPAASRAHGTKRSLS